MPGKWSNVEELLASIVEVLGDSRNLFVLANRDPKKPKPDLPVVRVPRPGDGDGQTQGRTPATPEELSSFLGRRGIVVRYEPKTDTDGG